MISQKQRGLYKNNEKKLDAQMLVYVKEMTKFLERHKLQILNNKIKKSE